MTSTAKWQREYRKRNKEQFAAYERKKLYGITQEEFEALLLKQDNVCGICREPFKDTFNRHVDHDHSTGEIRGILCADCNRGLGCFKDSPDILDRAKAWLK